MAMMLTADWAQVLVTLVGGMVIAISFVWAIRSDMRLLGQRLDTTDQRVGHVERILERVANTQGQLDIFNERQMAQGKRIDELSRRFNDWTELVYEERHKTLQERISKLEIGPQ